MSHDHGHSHDHDHDHAHAHGTGDPGRLRVALVATAAIATLECVGGFAAHSLALLSDSVHVFLDVAVLLISLGALHLSARPANARQSFGFARTEILAALLNGSLLFAVTVLIAMEAVKRLSAPQAPEGPLMAAVAGIGFVVNVVLGISLMRSAHGNLNMRAALLHIAGDALASLGVVISGVVIWRFGVVWLDPAMSLLVAVVIVIGVVNIVREAADVLLESAPAHADVDSVALAIRSIDGVVGVHDLHVWTIGTGTYAVAGHVLLPDSRISEATNVLRTIDQAMRERFAISHVTLQFECESCADDDRVVCTQMGVAPRGATLEKF